jgi:hypothetical protein
MAQKYFTQLTQLAAGSVAPGDAFAIEDISGGETKYITAQDTATYLTSLIGAGGWNAVAGTWTYASAITVTVPSGGASIYNIGDKVRFKQGGGYKFFYVYGVTDTLLSLTGGADYTVASSAITDMYYSKMENPLDFPAVFSYESYVIGYSSAPSGYSRFALNRNIVTVFFRLPLGGTSNSTEFTVTGPLVSKAITGMYWGNSCWETGDAGLIIAEGQVYIGAASNVINLYKTAGGAWTASGAKGASFTLSYEI